MEQVERLFSLAVERGHLREQRVKSLLSLVSMRRGDVHTAGELLSTYHGVAAETVEALVAEITAAPEPVEAPEEPARGEPCGALIAPKARPAAPSGPSGALITPKASAPPAAEEELVEFELVEDDAPALVAAVASGRSARAGEALDADTRAVLIVYPVADPSKAQLNAVSEALGVILYEARLRMAEPLPRLAASGPASELLPKVDRLREANIPCLCIEHEALFPKLRSLAVTAIARNGFALEMTLEECWENGARSLRPETVRLDLDRPRLLVIGRYDFEAKGITKQSLGLGARKKKVRTETNEFVSFGHLYYEDSETPIEVNDEELKDFNFLEDEKRLSQRQNLAKVFNMIASGRNATRDESLQKYAGRIKDSTSSVGPGARQANNVAQADALSRALYFKWLEQLG
jgi:hypothetical protein